VENHAAQRENSLRQRAAAVLARVAAKSPKIAMIATSIKLDAFTKVIEEIDKMIVELKDQQADEVKHRDFCIAELNKNTLQMDEAHAKRDSLEANIADMQATIKKLAENIETTKKEIAEMEVEMKRAGEDRAAENADYQQTVNDHRITQEILKKALQRMKQVYKSLLQGEPATPPVHFQPYKKNAGGSPVISLMEQIVEDSKKVEAEAIQAENEAQAAYEGFVKTANESISANEAAILSKSKAIAAAETERETAFSKKADTEVELEDLATYAADLHTQCDFLLKNFDIRQSRRDDEVEALEASKGILSGAGR